MTKCKSALGYRMLFGLMAGAMFLTLLFSGNAGAQSIRTIDAGTTITIRTNREIDAHDSDGRVFSGVVDRDVLDTRDHVAIPRGADVELFVRRISRNTIVLDLDSVVVNGMRYGLQTENAVVDSQQRDGNKRTGEMVGGGAVIGTILGAIAGGGRGALIGGGIGASAGASAEIITRGRNVYVPAESLLTFRLEQTLQTGVEDHGFNRNGEHYHSGYGTMPGGNSSAYQDGQRAGQMDSERNLNRNAQSNRWTSGQQLHDYQSGYSEGYNGGAGKAKPMDGSIKIGADRNISWQGPANSKVYSQVDNNPRQLFAEGASGSQRAPWITAGHLYVFTLQDSHGADIASSQSDLRQKHHNLLR